MRPLAAAIAMALLTAGTGAALAATKSKGPTTTTNGASKYAPGQHSATECAGPGKSGCAPGQLKPDGSSAKTYTPGYNMQHPTPSKKRKP